MGKAGKIKRRLALLLAEKFPDILFDPEDIKRHYSTVKSDSHCYWSAEGKKDNKSVWFAGQSSMTDCVVSGIRVQCGVTGNFVYENCEPPTTTLSGEQKGGEND